MGIGRHTSLFFHASVLVARAHSPGGGSALLLEACKVGEFQALATSAIFLETSHALRRFHLEARRRFDRLLIEINWEILTVPPAETIAEYAQHIDPVDAHVLASAVEGGAEYLLTLDRRHILAASEAVERAGLRIRILRPGDFIRLYYAQHGDYPDLPPTRS